MNANEAKATMKSINRQIRKHWYGGMIGWDFTTFTVIYPRISGVFNQAAEVLTGRKGRYLPKA